MEQVKMYWETMKVFKAEPEMPKTQLISKPLPRTPATGTEMPQIAIRNVDVFQLMSELTGKVGVMNFASPVHPGGGVAFGARAQEEAIAKGTFLVPALEQHMADYYDQNCKQPNRGLFSSKLIYAEHVRQVFDDQGRRLPKKYVDVVTVAAPDRRVDPQLDDATAMKDIAFKVLQTLRAFKAHDVDQLILGAFGTGVFGNPVKPVAGVFRKALLLPEFAGAFKRVYFAIYDPQMRTIKSFAAALKGEDE
ncbi:MULTISPECIES: TIGR02452 family protein [Lacticaseibacillus]|uniref:TIGR02452 family protein n=2 Tax=Lacticaseibacillus TaxID=2759736 RepID=A0A5R8LT60_LACZE|nr:MULTISPECIES: TIGR02452 family protein [Lacticaseibacillus]HAJ54779.1 TIGR02452 family protein [Lactobacillus sp.]MBI6597258.1 TIGR02452 family protein [Lacticaseibacillus casei]MBO1480925.1 TIGR02452 family protein [Lacticaseibacillus casei]MBO2416204.1 TIGR02452 family protein [Lacticaseibacillus casei]MCK2080657.1 TIGR02452 family protein [Lacticaseibacillus casei]